MWSSLEREAAEVVAEALAQRNALHLRGARALHRERLARAIELAEQVLRAAEVDPITLAGAQRTALLAHVARAKDARHGAGQLSQSAQRAPTEEDCEQGWEKVASIVATAEASAREAARLAARLEDAKLRDAAAAAMRAAREARAIVDARNHAYTFHTNPTFSFGEGWYVAAAGVLAGIAIQVEPNQPQTDAAERFLREAGLGAQLAAYRSRPRANKALPDLIARAFGDHADSAQTKLRAAFLGTHPVPRAIARWTDARFASAPPDKAKVLVWVRTGSAHQPERNSTAPEVRALCERAIRAQCVPVLIGDAMPLELPGIIDLTLFWRLPHFPSPDIRLRGGGGSTRSAAVAEAAPRTSKIRSRGGGGSKRSAAVGPAARSARGRAQAAPRTSNLRRAQLQVIEHLRRAHALAGQVGVTTAGMDGHALMGLRTMYLTERPNVRLGRWMGRVPGYEEVLRRPGYLDRIERSFCEWAESASR